jgi:hypothetical protein
MCKSTGCLGTAIRIFLAALNIIFILIGLGVLVLGLILKFTTLLTSYVKQLKTLGVPESALAYLDYVYIGLMVLGGVVLLISVIGLVAACSGIRFFLVLYDLIVLVIFLAHVAAFIYVIIVAPQAQTVLKGVMSTMLTPLVSQLNSTASYNLSQSDLSGYCQPYAVLSGLLKCCDFTSGNLTAACCPSSYSGGCADTFHTLMTTYVVYVVHLPNGVLVAFELAIFIAVLFVLIKKWKWVNEQKGGPAQQKKKNQVAPSPGPKE